MKLTVMQQVEPAAECLILLSRRCSDGPEAQRSIPEAAKRLCAKYDIPFSLLSPTITPLAQIEDHVLQGLTASPEQLRFFFSSTDGSYANPAWSLYFLDREGTRFSQLGPEDTLSQLQHFLCMALNCPPEATARIRDLPELSDFLEASACSPLAKWSCLRFWRDPAGYQAQYHKMMAEAVSLFREMAPTIDQVLRSRLGELQALYQDPQRQTLIGNIAPDFGGDVTLYPSVMFFKGSGGFWDHSQAGGPALFLAGVLYPLLSRLIEQHRNDSELLAGGAKTLANVHRINILKALKVRPMCNQELSELLGLSAATVSQHMSCLIADGFVTTSKRGNWVDYSLQAENLAVFWENVRAALL